MISRVERVDRVDWFVADWVIGGLVDLRLVDFRLTDSNPPILQSSNPPIPHPPCLPRICGRHRPNGTPARKWRRALRPHRSTIKRLPSGAVAWRVIHFRIGPFRFGAGAGHGWHEARQRRRAARRSRPGRLALMARRVIHPPLRDAELGRSSRRSPSPSRRRLPCRAGLAPSRSPPFRPSPCALKAFLYGASPDACAYPCAIHVIG